MPDSSLSQGHEPITVTILSSTRAAKDVDWDEGDLIWLARQEEVLIDAANPTHAAAFGISQFYLPQAWVEDVKARPRCDDDE